MVAKKFLKNTPVQIYMTAIVKEQLLGVEPRKRSPCPAVLVHVKH